MNVSSISAIPLPPQKSDCTCDNDKPRHDCTNGGFDIDCANDCTSSKINDYTGFSESNGEYWNTAEPPWAHQSSNLPHHGISAAEAKALENYPDDTRTYSDGTGALVVTASRIPDDWATQDFWRRLPTHAGGSVVQGRGETNNNIDTELLLDLTQMALDIGGIFDPTPISDGASGLISLYRGHYLDAAISAVSMVPYAGDLAKVGKLGRYAETLAKAVEAAKHNPQLAQAIAPAIGKVRDAVGALPLDKLPDSVRNAVQPLKTQVDDFARISVKELPIKVGKNRLNWLQNADGDTIGARAILREVFHKVPRSASEIKAQAATAARGIKPNPEQGIKADVGGHILGHRFVKDKGVQNMFPQNAHFNNSAYKKMENEWADWIEKKGGSVEVDIKLIGDTKRPAAIKTDYILVNKNGTIYKTRSEEFENFFGAVFNRERFK